MAAQDGTKRHGFWERLQRIDRRWIYLVIWLVVMIPLIRPFPIKPVASPPVQQMFSYIDTMPEDKALIISVDYSPDTQAELHPMTLIQNARTSGGGVVQNVPSQALSVGPAETWKAEKVSIWQAGSHDNPFGMRLTTLMIAKHLPDAAVPMSLLADHPNVQFNFYRHGIGSTSAEMH